MEPAAYATVLETVIRYKTKLSTFRAYNTSLRCPLSCLITLWQKIKLIVELKFLNQMHAKEIFATLQSLVTLHLALLNMYKSYSLIWYQTETFGLTVWNKG